MGTAATWMMCLLLGQAAAAPAPAPRKPPPGQGLPAGAPPAPQALPPGRARLEQLLRGSSEPPAAGDLAAVGRDVDALLVAMARDPQLDLPLRARAVGALAKVPTPATRAFLTALVEDPAEALAPPAARRSRGKKTPAATTISAPSDEVTRTLQRRAAVSLGWMGGAQVPALLGPLLAHGDPEVRADAAVALALTRLPEAARLLRARIDVETDPRVRGHLARQLNVIEAALGPTTPAPTPPPRPPGPPGRSEF